jgi:GNAT superfamily N-acetyltransferase
MTIQLLAPAEPQVSPLSDFALHKVRELLDFLPLLYPGGADWLINRMNEIGSGQAEGTGISVDGRLIALTIAFHKPTNRMKLCTLFVSPEFRGQGIGRALLDASVARAYEIGAESVYITVAETVAHTIVPLLNSRNFATTDLVPDRYGPGRNELILNRDLSTHSL